MKSKIIYPKFLFFVLVILIGCSPYTKGKPINKNLSLKQAILIIDIQKDFFDPNGKMPVDNNQSKLVLQNINKILSSERSKQFEIIYIGNEFKRSDRVLNWFRNYAAVQGTHGASLAEGLMIVNNIYFAKDQSDAFSNKIFENYLREKNITGLIITGVFANHCVLSTVKGALNRGYSVSVLSDAVATNNDNNLNNALIKYKNLGVNIIKTEDFLNN